MKTRAAKSRGPDPCLGQVVQVMSHEVDSTKLSPSNITAVVVKINLAKRQVKLGIKTGNLLKGNYAFHLCTVQTNATRGTHGLSSIFDHVQIAPLNDFVEITEREAVGLMNPAIHNIAVICCKCTKGKCNSNQCKCWKNGSKCTTKCHGKTKVNLNCCNRMLDKL